MSEPRSIALRLAICVVVGGAIDVGGAHAQSVGEYAAHTIRFTANLKLPQ